MYQSNYPAGVDDSVIEDRYAECPMGACRKCAYCARVRGQKGDVWVCAYCPMTGDRESGVEVVDPDGRPSDCDSWTPLKGAA